MAELSAEKKLSEFVSEPILKAYRAGGFALAFLTLGAILLLAAFRWNNKGAVTYAVLAVGVILIAATLLLFYFKDIRKLKRAHDSVRENAALIDAVQQSAIELTELASTMQALLFKHADDVAKALKAVRPVLRNIPGLAALAESELVMRTEALSATIVTSTENIKSVVQDLRAALVRSDPKVLTKYVEQLHQYRGQLVAVLANQRELKNGQKTSSPHV